MKKILEIINLSSSARLFIGDQFLYFRERGGYEMHLICTPDNEIEDFVRMQKVKYTPLELPRRVSLFRDIKSFWEIYKYIRKERFDAVICHQAKARLLGIIAAKLSRVPVRISYAHGAIYETKKGCKRKMLVFNDRLVSYFSTDIIAVSPSVMDARKKDSIDKDGKCKIVGKGTCNGVDSKNQFNPNNINKIHTKNLAHSLNISKGDFVIGYCGRLVRDKGVSELILAFDKLTKKHPTKSIKMLIVGKKECHDTLPENIVKILHTCPNIIYSGYISHDIIQNYYSLMDVFLLPSYREGFPTVVLEASSMQLPVITSKSTGCVDSIINGVTGIYTQITPNDICYNIERIMMDSNRRKYGIAGRKYIINNFEHLCVRENIFNHINNIING